ncbi:O-antigen ligase family protein [Rhizobium tubonense]|uniref:O-antigen ligase n=1 Tax=Rhizobium tubonense TaxID=484088 RepID=A0A2W4CKM9_9HYPH|nr:O-antigen ligase family protein [Rhizobium tubonense]PZM11518.1 O-antigen ligase [Rhizobium tubonense]
MPPKTTPVVSMRTMGLPLTLLGCVLWLLVASPVFVESDTYRYASAILAIIALVHYLKMEDRPRTNLLGWLCMGWGLYVVVRFAAIYFMTPGHDLGASDWLFAFPFFFPILGVAFGLYEAQFERIVAAFFVVAVVMLVTTTHFQLIFAGETVKPLIMNNQIHGAVACGLILISASFWLLHYMTNKSSNPAFARFAYFAAPLIIIVCFIAIYGAKSKGVWLALIVTLPIVGLVALTYLRRKMGVVIIVCAAALLLAGIYTVRHNLNKTAGPTVTAAITMLEGIDDGRDVSGVVAGAIASTATPFSMDERLQLWYNAGELISAAPWFGWENQWLERWHQTRYANVQYTLLHNGYLEMLVRFGAFGAFVMTTILASLVVSVWRAFRSGLIPRAVLHTYALGLLFFAFTLLSNSNNRLAIGESLALLSSAFACWCNMRINLKPTIAHESTSPHLTAAKQD